MIEAAVYDSRFLLGLLTTQEETNLLRFNNFLPHFGTPAVEYLETLVAQMVKNPPAMQETWVQSPVGKIPWRIEWLSTPLFLPGESPWIEEPDRLQSMVSQSRTQLSS